MESAIGAPQFKAAAINATQMIASTTALMNLLNPKLPGAEASLVGTGGRLVSPTARWVAAAASPRTTFTSLPLPTPRIWVAAPRLAAISR